MRSLGNKFWICNIYNMFGTFSSIRNYHHNNFNIFSTYMKHVVLKFLLHYIHKHIHNITTTIIISIFTTQNERRSPGHMNTELFIAFFGQIKIFVSHWLNVISVDKIFMFVDNWTSRQQMINNRHTSLMSHK